MMTSEILNYTDGIYLLKEVRGKSYTQLAELRGNGSTFSIDCDPNATYRDYWVGTTSIGDEIITISSDDLQEHSAIVLTRSGTTNETIKRTIKRNYEQGSQRDWTKVLNKSDRDCIIKRVNSTGEEKVGMLKKKDGKKDGSFYIFSDDPNNPASFQNHKVVLTENTEVSVVTENTEVSVLLSSSDCFTSEQFIIESTGPDSTTAVIRACKAEPTGGRTVVPARASNKKSTWLSFLQFAGRVVGIK
ncbi:hypothetical protein M758_6G177600 [Ceratodon purpureus]|nr:hypothetical protein M758_6G177600 [Ceratodon purpureus]